MSSMDVDMKLMQEHMREERKILQAQGNQLKEHVEKCDRSNLLRLEAEKVTNDTLAKLVTAVADIKSAPMRAVKWLGGIIIAAILGSMIQNLTLHNETAAKADLAAQQATVAAEGQAKVIKKLDALSPDAPTISVSPKAAP